MSVKKGIRITGCAIPNTEATLLKKWGSLKYAAMKLKKLSVWRWQVARQIGAADKVKMCSVMWYSNWSSIEHVKKSAHPKLMKNVP